MALSKLDLLRAAHAVVGGTNEEFGKRLYVSKRTVVRWYAKDSYPTRDVFEALAKLVHPTHPALAAAIADSLGTTLEYLGIVAPPPPPPPRDAIDGVVCVAAEAMDASPRPMRAALLAACRRARRLGYTLETMEDALTEPGASPSADMNAGDGQAPRRDHPSPPG